MATAKKVDADIVEEAAPAVEKRVTIKLPIIFGGDNGDVFVSVNERTWLIKRGVEVSVPECVAEVLRTSEKQRETYAALVEALRR